jgi:hypothetical protein
MSFWPQSSCFKLLVQTSWVQTRPNYAWLASPHFVVARGARDHHHDSAARNDEQDRLMLAPDYGMPKLQ